MVLAAVFFVPALIWSYIISCVISVGDQCQVSSNTTAVNPFSGSCPGYPEATSRDLHPSHVAFYPVKGGVDVRLNCAPCGQSLHNVRWRRVWTREPTMPDAVRCLGNDLIIPKFGCTDQGNYVCSAMCGDRPVTEQWKSVWIRDASKCIPTIPDEVQIENNVTGRIGESLTLPCRVAVVKGSLLDPIAGFHSQWFRGRISGKVFPALDLCHPVTCGKYFQCSMTESVAADIKDVNLTISKLRKEDDGWYTCMAMSLSMWNGLHVEANIYYYVTLDDNSKSAQNGSSSPQLQTGNETPLVAGLVVVAITLISIILVIVVVWWRKHLSNKKRLSNGQSHHPISRFIYISYAEDTPTHLESVKSMASQLSELFSCHLYDEHRNEAANMFVHNWLSQQITRASHIIVVASPRYRILAEEMQQNGVNIKAETQREFMTWEQRVRYEWNLIQSREFRQQQNFAFCSTVLWDGSNKSDILFPLSTRKRYNWPSETSVLKEDLENEGLRHEVSDETNEQGDASENEQERVDNNEDLDDSDSVKLPGARLSFRYGEDMVG